MCTNCLRTNHKFAECRSTDSCKKCGYRHATLLHQDSTKNNPNVKNITVSVDESHNKHNSADNASQDNQVLNSNNLAHNSKNFSSFNSELNREPSILLSTALVHAKDNKNNTISCRILLDNGSQSNFVSKSFANRLKLPVNKINIPVSSINEVKTNINEQTYVPNYFIVK